METIWKIEWYNYNDNESNANMYFLEQTETDWAKDWKQGRNGSDYTIITKVEVSYDSNEYKSAFQNSSLNDLRTNAISFFTLRVSSGRKFLL